MLRKTVLAGLAVAAAIGATPAAAQSVVLADSVSLEVGSPLSFAYNFAATSGDQPLGASATIVFNYLGTSSLNAYDFTFTADNTSTSPSPMARLVSFGFDAENPTSITGSTYSYNFDFGNFNGLGSVDVCFYTGSNCNGNGGGGITVAQAPVTGAFTLNYAGGANPPLILSNFRARFQSTGLTGEGSASGPGMTSTIPEPATWGMMLLGFGAIGFAMRRKKVAKATFSYA